MEPASPKPTPLTPYRPDLPRAAVAGLLLAAFLSGCVADAPTAADVAPTGATAASSTAGPGSSGSGGAVPPVNGTNDNASKPLAELHVGLSGVYPVLIGFDPPQMQAAAGSRLKVTFHNSDLNPLGKHNWKIKDTEFGTEVIGVGESASVEFDAPAAGTYDYVCSVPSHEGFGMKGTLTIA